MGNISASIPQKIALRARDHFGLTGLIETGTFMGDTALWASKNFERVATIEISREYYEISERQLKDTHNVLMMLGDSREWLAPFCRGRDNRPTLFWLDAHVYDGTDCPILDEIKIVNDNFFGQHVIMVDDYEMLSRWGLSNDVIRLLVDKTNHQREVRIIDDVIFACQKLPDDFESWRI